MRAGHIQILFGILLFLLEFLDDLWRKVPLAGVVIFVLFVFIVSDGIARLAASYVRDGFDGPPKQE